MTKQFGIAVTHSKCGQKLGTMSSLDDHGSFEMICPKCNEWIEVFNQFLSGDLERAETHNYVRYDLIQLNRSD